MLTPNRGGRKAADGHRVVVAVAVLDEAESHTCTALTPTEAEIVAAAVVMDRGGGDSSRVAVTAVTEAVAATADRSDGRSDRRRVGCASRRGGKTPNVHGTDDTDGAGGRTDAR